MRPSAILFTRGSVTPLWLTDTCMVRTLKSTFPLKHFLSLFSKVGLGELPPAHTTRGPTTTSPAARFWLSRSARRSPSRRPNTSRSRSAYLCPTTSVSPSSGRSPTPSAWTRPTTSATRCQARWGVTLGLGLSISNADSILDCSWYSDWDLQWPAPWGVRGCQQAGAHHHLQRLQALASPVQSYKTAAFERIINLESAVNQSIKNFNRFLVIGLQIKREEFSPMGITQTQQLIIDYTPIVLVLIRGSQSFLVYNISFILK